MKNNINFMRILQICDSLFPIGAFTLSNGLETYVQKELISSPDGLEEYLRSYISLLAYNELGSAAIAYRSDENELIRLDEIYTACKAPAEIRKGSQRVARRFFRASEKISESAESLNNYKRLVELGKCSGHQCIAYGLFIKDCGEDLSEGLGVYGYSICSAIVTNCVKLVPLSQLAGQKILAESFEHISAAAEKAMQIGIDEIGVCGAGFELRAMEHEKLYSRQYMS